MFNNIFKKQTTYVSVNLDEKNGKVKANSPRLLDLTEKKEEGEQKKSYVFEDLKPKKDTSPFKVKIHGEDDIEKGEYVFRKVYLNDDVKFNLFRGLTSPDPFNLILKGKAASGKSLMMMCIVEHFTNVIHLTAKSSFAGLVEKLKENPNANILIIEEFDRWNKNDIDECRSLFSDGIINKSLKYEDINIKMEGLKVLITTNGLVKMDEPILSRFLEWHLPEYTDEEFKELCAYCLPGFRTEITHGLAEVLMAHNMKDVRDVILVSRMLRPYDSDRVIEKIVTGHIKLSTTKTKDVDWNKRK